LPEEITFTPLGTSSDKTAGTVWTTTEIYTVESQQTLYVLLACDTTPTSVEWNGCCVGYDRWQNNTFHVGMYTLKVCSAGSSAITVRFASSTTAKALAVYVASGYEMADRSGADTGFSGVGVDTGLTSATTENIELLVSAVALEGPSGDTAGTFGGDIAHTGLRSGTAGGAADTNITVSCGYSTQTETGQRHATLTGQTPRKWSAAIVCYKPRGVYEKIWRKRAAHGLPAIFDYGLAYDEERDEVVMGGGIYAPETAVWDTHIYKNGVWTLKSPAHTPPVDSRRGVSLCYDPIRKNVISCGGGLVGGAKSPFPTWKWDGIDWINASPAHSPVSFKWPTVCWNPISNKILLLAWSGTFADVFRFYEWDGTDWTELTSVHRPPTRCMAGMSYDPISERIILFGGQGPTATTLYDTWAWDGVDWTELHPDTPVGVNLFFSWGQTLSIWRGQIYFVGGCDVAGSTQALFVARWTGSDWELVSVVNPTASPWLSPWNGSPPAARVRFASVAFSSEDCIVVPSGLSPYGTLPDTWELIGQPDITGVEGSLYHEFSVWLPQTVFDEYVVNVAPDVDKSIAPSDFERESDVFNRRPIIEWEVPPIDEDDAFYSTKETEEYETELKDLRETVDDLINSYNALEKLADVIENKINDKVKGYVVKLNPVIDSHVIEAIKRAFPEVEDPTKINFEMYKQCLARYNKSNTPVISEKDVQEAKNDPTRTDFGGYGNEPGMNRPEIQQNGMMKPLDLKKFQKGAITKLWKQILAPVKDQTLLAILIHKATSIHGS